MSDELNKNAEFVGKHQDEENPVLVAQRYLNIYRQLHIFNKKRQDEFDDSLLKMPSDIRILLSTLPGGSLLLEHLAEVEEKRGIIPDELLSSKINESADSARQDRSKLVSRLTAKNAEGANLAHSLSKILQQNEEKHAQDLKAFTDAFLQSQENMTAVLRQALSAKTPPQSVRHPATPTPTRTQPAAHQMPRQTSAQPLRREQPIPQDEASMQEAASKILNFTKKLFTTPHKAEDGLSEAPNKSIPEAPRRPAPERPKRHVAAPLVDQTPVSLDEIESAPVSLGVSDSSANIQTEQTTPAVNNDWEWQYVDNNAAQTDDGEWEYIDADENSASPEEWTYVEDPNTAYTYEYPASDNNEEWEYVEDDGSNQNPSSNS